MRGVQTEEAKGKVAFPRHLSQQSLQTKIMPESGFANNKPPPLFWVETSERLLCVPTPVVPEKREREHHVDIRCVSRVVQPGTAMRQLCEAVSTTALRVQAQQH